MSNLSRRTLLHLLPTAAAGASLVSLQAKGALAGQAADTAYQPLAQIRVGRFTVTALSDGYADMPYTYFPGRTAEQVEAAAKSEFTARPTGVRFLFNQFLVQDGTSLILIDSGPAGIFGETGHLPQGLARLGVRPEQIDAVIITHMHHDHTGGLVAGGRRVFPKAEVYADRRDVRYWTDPANEARAPEFLKSSFRVAGDVVRLYPKLQATEAPHEVTRGVSLIDLTGHTPGHIGVRIEDGGQTLIMASDMVFPVVHPSGADVNFLFELDRPAAQAMRAKFFPWAAETGALVAATHMPFPGLGRIVSDQGRLRWQPADWAYQS
jgi:glyoxylase-like metal-dependent hydrolase (beta-lactamase superfamily II)